MTRDTVIADDTLNLDLIRQDLDAQTVGHRILLYDEAPSTNAVLRELAAGGAPDGTVVVADSQSAGRGRGDAPWYSPPGVNLYASILLRPEVAPAAAPLFAFIAPLALADAIRELGLPVAIKWPNDVLVRGHKVAGVRAEVAIAGDAVAHVILGVGVNLNVSRAALRAALGEAGQAATSLRDALGRPIDRNAFTAAFLNALEAWRVIHREQGSQAVLSAWRDLDIVTGRRVEVREGSRRFEGRALGIDAEGHLRVEDTQRRVHTVAGGEVRLVE
jgi:BirA family transcriptional regulator, biotin operon repressor / biotin---[acetyl-CoA-carboxylase] ligase